MKKVENKISHSETPNNHLPHQLTKLEKANQIRSYIWLNSAESHHILTPQNCMLSVLPSDSTEACLVELSDQCTTIGSGQNLIVWLQANKNIRIDIKGKKGSVLLLFWDAGERFAEHHGLEDIKQQLTVQTKICCQYNVPGLKNWPSKLSAISRRQTDCMIMRLKALFYEILACQCESFQAKNKHVSAALFLTLKPFQIANTTQAKKIIEQNIHQNFTIKELANMVGTNEQYLKQHFKILFDQTITEYKTSVKMEYAKQLIESGCYQVWEVAHQVGYHHPTHFTAVFKKHFGINPKDVK